MVANVVPRPTSKNLQGTADGEVAALHMQYVARAAFRPADPTCRQLFFSQQGPEGPVGLLDHMDGAFLH
jgi:hypothetical protein